MHQPEVDSQFVGTITNDQDAYASAAVREGIIQSSPQTSLSGNSKALLDISVLRNGNDATVFAHIKETILFEDRAGHRLYQDRW